MKSILTRAISLIEKQGILLVFPIQNRPDPPSLWSCLHPRTPMRWEWDSSGDSRVVQMWHLREELSRSGRVVYGKWYKGRATLFSKEVASALISQLESVFAPSPAARKVMQLLEEDSPLSSKILKKRLVKEYGLNSQGVDKALAELWSCLKIVGFGEVDDGAFPSLAIGATSVLFEKAFRDSKALTDSLTQELLRQFEGGLFGKHLRGLLQKKRPKAVSKTTVRFDDLVGLKRDRV